VSAVAPSGIAPSGATDSALGALEVLPVEIGKIGERTLELAGLTGDGLHHSQVSTWAQAETRKLFSRNAAVVGHDQLLLGVRLDRAHDHDGTTLSRQEVGRSRATLRADPW